MHVAITDMFKFKVCTHVQILHKQRLIEENKIDFYDYFINGTENGLFDLLAKQHTLAI